MGFHDSAGRVKPATLRRAIADALFHTNSN
jgi:hypothetical protein